MSGRYTGPTAIAMSPTTWAWLLSVVDTTGRPLLGSSGNASNAIGLTTAPNYELGSVGSIMGIPVVLDGNILHTGYSTTETRVIVADFRDCVLFEDNGGAPQQIKFEGGLSTPETLTVRLVAYGYSAFASGRQPKAISVISGTGLIVPTL
jgi:HK97 family phage major capsid protein